MGLSLLAVGAACGSTEAAGRRRRVFYPIPQYGPASPYGGNIFGQNLSGVAGPTAPSHGGSSYRGPTGGARTGGVND